MSKRGFTLIELILVISIIGVLAGFIYPNYVTSLKRGRDGKRKSDLEQIRAALEMYKADDGAYPTSLNLLVSGGYISEIPSDPRGYSYYYNRISENEYELCAYLEMGGSDNCGNNCSAPGNCNYKVINP